MSFSINIKHGLSSHMLGITKWYLKRCVSWLQDKLHKRHHTTQAFSMLGKGKVDTARGSNSALYCGGHTAPRRAGWACSGIKCLPTSVSDSSLVSEVCNFLWWSSVLWDVQITEYPPLLSSVFSGCVICQHLHAFRGQLWCQSSLWLWR